MLHFVLECLNVCNRGRVCQLDGWLCFRHYEDITAVCYSSLLFTIPLQHCCTGREYSEDHLLSDCMCGTWARGWVCSWNGACLLVRLTAAGHSVAISESAHCLSCRTQGGGRGGDELYCMLLKGCSFCAAEQCKITCRDFCFHECFLNACKSVYTISNLMGFWPICEYYATPRHHVTTVHAFSLATHNARNDVFSLSLFIVWFLTLYCTFSWIVHPKIKFW